MFDFSVDEDTLGNIVYGDFFSSLSKHYPNSFRFLSNRFIQRKLGEIYSTGGEVGFSGELGLLLKSHFISFVGDPSVLSVRVAYVTTNKGDFYYLYVDRCEFGSALWFYNHVMLNTVYHYFKSRRMLSVEVQEELRSNPYFAFRISFINSLQSALCGYGLVDVEYDLVDIESSCDTLGSIGKVDRLFNEVISLAQSGGSDSYDLHALEGTPLNRRLHKLGRSAGVLSLEFEALDMVLPNYYMWVLSFYRSLTNALIVGELLGQGDVDAGSLSAVLKTKGSIECITSGVGHFVFEPSSSRSSTFTLYKPYFYKCDIFDAYARIEDITTYTSLETASGDEYSYPLTILENIEAGLPSPVREDGDVLEYEELGIVSLCGVSCVPEGITSDSSFRSSYLSEDASSLRGRYGYRFFFRVNKGNPAVLEECGLRHVEDDVYVIKAVIPIGSILLV